MKAHAFSPSIQEEEAGISLEFEDSVVYKASSRTVMVDTKKNSVLKKKKKLQSEAAEIAQGKSACWQSKRT